MTQRSVKNLEGMDGPLLERFDEAECLSTLVPQLINKLKQESEIEVPPEYTKFLERCLRVKDFNLEKAFILVVNVQKASKHPYLKSIKEKFQMSVAQQLIDDGVFSMLKSRDHFGRQVYLLRFGNWKPAMIEYDMLVATFNLLNTWAIGQSAETQRNGMIFLYDMTNFGMVQIRSLKLSNLQKLSSMAGSSIPVKIKALHFVFHPRIFGPFFQMLRPFLKEKLSKRLHFHGDDTSKLHQHLRPEILPASLGGSLDERDAIDLELLEKFTNEHSFAQEVLVTGFPKQ